MKARWDGMLAGRDPEGRSFKAFLGPSARTGPVYGREAARVLAARLNRCAQ